MKKLFFDVETTGTDYRKHSIVQISCLLEIDGQIIAEFYEWLKPHPKALIEPEALNVIGVTKEELMAGQDQHEGFAKFKKFLGQHIDPYNTKDKAFLCGFNNRAFDDDFLRMWFTLNQDRFFGAWFWQNSLDAMVLATEFLLTQRPNMPNFKLHRVAEALDIPIETEKLHDARYDVQLTRKIYQQITSKMFTANDELY